MSEQAAPTSYRPLLAAAFDAVAIMVFAALGRASHAEANPVLGAMVTAWPFLVGAAAGWVVCLARWRTAPWTLSHSWPVWLSAVALGMVLRTLTDQGTALPFVIVATLFLGVVLMGWRAIAAFHRRYRD